jgi:hypothetical protein
MIFGVAFAQSVQRNTRRILTETFFATASTAWQSHWLNSRPKGQNGIVLAFNLPAKPWRAGHLDFNSHLGFGI